MSLKILNCVNQGFKLKAKCWQNTQVAGGFASLTRHENKHWLSIEWEVTISTFTSYLAGGQISEFQI